MKNVYGSTVWNEVRKCKTYPHVAAWENFMGIEVPFDDNGKRCIIHHLDENQLNNDILNLVCMTRSEHQRFHSKKTWTGRHHSAKTLQKMRKPKSEEHKKNLSIALKGKTHKSVLKGKPWSEARRSAQERRKKK